VSTARYGNTGCPGAQPPRYATSRCRMVRRFQASSEAPRSRGEGGGLTAAARRRLPTSRGFLLGFDADAAGPEKSAASSRIARRVSCARARALGGSSSSSCGLPSLTRPSRSSWVLSWRSKDGLNLGFRHIFSGKEARHLASQWKAERCCSLSCCTKHCLFVFSYSNRCGAVLSVLCISSPSRLQR
jgi:hypothetical protein